MAISGSFSKASDHFRARCRGNQIRQVEMFFMSTASLSGVTVPSGVLIWNTTTNRLEMGIGSTSRKYINVT